tara:strand:+ start:351 stop:470 length:120 start_codon:yes stop_codon:yes gene_type:complete
MMIYWKIGSLSIRSKSPIFIVVGVLIVEKINNCEPIERA